MSENKELIWSLNQPIDLTELQGAMDDRLTLELLEERLELGCWIQCTTYCDF